MEIYHPDRCPGTSLNLPSSRKPSRDASGCNMLVRPAPKPDCNDGSGEIAPDVFCAASSGRSKIARRKIAANVPRGKIADISVTTKHQKFPCRRLRPHELTLPRCGITDRADPATHVQGKSTRSCWRGKARHEQAHGPFMSFHDPRILRAHRNRPLFIVLLANAARRDLLTIRGFRAAAGARR